MEPVIFLVTALTDVKNDRFVTTLQTLLDQHAIVRVLFAGLDFLERPAIDQQLAPIIAGHENQVTVYNLTDVFGQEPGTPLAPDTLKQVDTNHLTRRGGSVDHVVRYFLADQLLVEQHYDVCLVYQNFYIDNQLVQRIFYNASVQPLAVNNFQDEKLRETLLLNAHGELVYRLMLKAIPYQKFIGVGITGKLQPTALAVATERQRDQALIEMAAETTEVQVLDYVNAMNFKGQYDFYRYALQRLGGPSARLYVNVAHTEEISAVLPDQLIFNY